MCGTGPAFLLQRWVRRSSTTTKHVGRIGSLALRILRLCELLAFGKGMCAVRLIVVVGEGRCPREGNAQHTRLVPNYDVSEFCNSKHYDDEENLLYTTSCLLTTTPPTAADVRQSELLEGIRRCGVGFSADRAFRGSLSALAVIDTDDVTHMFRGPNSLITA